MNIDKCPDCQSERSTPSANGKKRICLACYFSWQVNPVGKTAEYQRRRYAEKKAKLVTPTYTDLWRENKHLKLLVDNYKLQVELLKERLERRI